MMVSGERAELRGLNLEGLRRRGFSVTEVCLEFIFYGFTEIIGLKFSYSLLFFFSCFDYAEMLFGVAFYHVSDQNTLFTSRLIFFFLRSE